MSDEPNGDFGLPAAMGEALPHLSRVEILAAISAIAHEYVARYDGSPESVLSVTHTVLDGVASGYGEAVEQEKRPPEER